MKIQKRLSALLLMLLLCCTMAVTAYAHEIPDMSKTGAISVAMTYNGEAVAGGTLTLYQVGEIRESDGNYNFVLTGDFTESGISLEDISSSGLVKSLENYINANDLDGDASVQIGNNGIANVQGLTLGLYLVTQTEAADGYETIVPFLVSVPMNEDGIYVYDVNATPKLSTLMETEPAPTVPATETEPMPTVPVTPPKPTLPQTGQLNWPVPVLAALGLCLFLAGWVLRYGKKENPYGA